MSTNSNSLNLMNRLLLFRGLAIITVVMGHANGWMVTAMFWWTHRYRSVTVPNFDQVGSFNYYALRFFEQLVVFCVPAFIFISGYFLARSTGDDTTISWEKIFKRIKRLLPPFLLWSTIVLTLEILQGETLTPLEFVLRIITGRASNEYFFPFLLIQFYLISPFIIPLARSKWKTLLIVAGLIHLTLMIIRYIALLNIDIPVTNMIFFLTRRQLLLVDLIWYSLGLVTYYHFDEIKEFLDRYKLALIIGLLGSLILGILEWEYIFQLSGKDWLIYDITIIDSIYTFLVIFTYIAVTKNLKSGSSTLFNLGSKSYGIYLIHPIVVMVAAKIIYHVFPILLAYPLAFYLVIVLLGLSVPVIMMVLTTKTPLNRFYELAFGRR